MKFRALFVEVNFFINKGKCKLPHPACLLRLGQWCVLMGLEHNAFHGIDASTAILCLFYTSWLSIDFPCANHKLYKNLWPHARWIRWKMKQARMVRRIGLRSIRLHVYKTCIYILQYFVFCFWPISLHIISWHCLSSCGRHCLKISKSVGRSSVCHTALCLVSTSREASQHPFSPFPKIDAGRRRKTESVPGN